MTENVKMPVADIIAGWRKQTAAEPYMASIVEQAMAKRIRELEAELAKAKETAQRVFHEVEQTLGKALGYPWYKDDPKNFPDATDADGVCVGAHVPESIALEAANRIAELANELKRQRHDAELQERRIEQQNKELSSASQALVNFASQIKKLEIKLSIADTCLVKSVEERGQLKAEIAKVNESGEVLHAKYREVEAGLAKVKQLGIDFGFSPVPDFSTEQVITHAKYLQKQRAELLFDNAQLRERLKRIADLCLTGNTAIEHIIWEIARGGEMGNEGFLTDPSELVIKKLAERERGKVAQLEADNARLRECLKKYTHCRHACMECFCTKEARAEIAPSNSKAEDRL
jgi:hypothetical protein